MFPFRDQNPTRIRPVVTLLLIGIDLYVFFIIQMQGTAVDQERLLYEQAAIACEVVTGEPLSREEILGGTCAPGDGAPVIPGKPIYLALFTTMFLHANIGHVLFNMWFLWIFGNNVEEAYGHLRYLLIYLVGGLFATASFVFLNPETTVPLVGASGAIAVAMGAYAVLFPGHRILTLIGWFLVPVPALLFLLIWFFAQFGLGGTGVAWEAHAGGFLFGAVVSLLFRRSLLRRVRSARAW